MSAPGRRPMAMPNLAAAVSRGALRSIRRSWISGVGQLALSQYAAGGLTFVTAAIAARWLGPRAYGVAALVMAYPALILAFASVKSISVSTRYISSFRAAGRLEDVASIAKLGYVVDLATSLTATAAVMATSGWAAARVLRVPDGADLVAAYALSLPFVSLSGTSLAILSSWQRFRLVAGLQIADKALTLAAVVTFLAVGQGVRGVVWGTALAQAVTGLVMLGTATALLRAAGAGFWWRGSVRRVRSLYREITAFFGWNYLVVTLSGLVMQIPLLLLGRLRGAEEAAYYRLGTTLMTAGATFETSLGRVSYPILSSRWGAGERESLEPTLRRWSLHGGLPASAAVVVTVLLLPLVIPLVFGELFRPMVPGAQIMVAAGVLSALFFWIPHLYYASGRFAGWTIAYGVHTAVVIGLSPAVITRWGFTGLAAVIAAGKVGLTVGLLLLLLLRRPAARA